MTPPFTQIFPLCDAVLPRRTERIPASFGTIVIFSTVYGEGEGGKVLEAFRNRHSPRPLVTLASSRVLQVKITYLRKREIILFDRISIEEKSSV